MIYDTGIIGAGLAGLALAIDLKSRGFNVLVIEKSDFPRHKVCGEYISMESWPYLQKICPELNRLDLPQIRNFKLSSGNSEFTTALDLGGFGISRYLLEDLLYQAAKNKGVVFKLNTKANAVEAVPEGFLISTNHEVIQAKLVCNASGRKSNFEAKENTAAVTGTNYIGIKYHLKTKRDPSLIEIHNFTGGYCGISNIEEGKSCLCYIVNARYLQRAGNSIAVMEKELLYKNKALEKIFTRAEFIYNSPLTISNINFRIKKTAGDTSFYLGDAAGSIAPITGNGMSIALRSAAVLAGEIDVYFSDHNSKQVLTDNYNKFWHQNFSTRIRLSRHFQKLAEFPPLTKMSIGVFKLMPFLAQTIIKQTHGQVF